MKGLLLRTVILCLLCGVALSNQVDDEWYAWKKKFDKHYPEEEEPHRFQQWKTKHQEVSELKARSSTGETIYKHGLNVFADLSREERDALICHMPTLPEGKATVPRGRDNSNLPYEKSVDWGKKGRVTKVRDQGKYGTCYAFSSAGAIEGQLSTINKGLHTLSVQQIVDCNQGDDGGLMHLAFQYLMEVGGLEKEEDYPYVGKKGNCKFNKSRAYTPVYSWARLPHDEDSLLRAVAAVGPVAVGFYQLYASFYDYPGGVYEEPLCDDPTAKPTGGHAVLITGYGTEGGKDYWLVKNSWGPRWGENGYIRMKRGNCNLTSYAVYPLLGKDAPGVSFNLTSYTEYPLQGNDAPGVSFFSLGECLTIAGSSITILVVSMNY